MATPLLSMPHIRKENFERLRKAILERRRSNPHVVGSVAPILLSFPDDEDEHDAVRHSIDTDINSATTTTTQWAPKQHPGTPASEVPPLQLSRSLFSPSFPQTPATPTADAASFPIVASGLLEMNDNDHSLLLNGSITHQRHDCTFSSNDENSFHLISQINKRLRRLYAMNSRILFYEALNHTHGKLNFPTHLPRGNICVVALLIDSIDSLWEKQDTQIMMKALDMFVDLLVHEMNHYAGQMAQTQADVFYVVFNEPFDALQFCISLQEKLLRIPWSFEFLAACAEVKVEVDQINRELIFRGIRLKSCLDVCNITQVERDVEHQRDLYPSNTLSRITNLVANFTSGGDILVSEECWRAIRNSIEFATKRKSEGFYVEERRFTSSPTAKMRPTSAWLILPKSLRGRVTQSQGSKFISSSVGEEDLAIKSIDLKYQQAELEDLIADLKKMYIQKVGMLRITTTLDESTARRHQEQQTEIDSTEQELLRLQRQLALQVASRSLNHISVSKPPSPSNNTNDTKQFFVQIDIPNVRLLWKECDNRGMLPQLVLSIQSYFHCIRTALEKHQGYEFAVHESSYFCCFNNAHDAIEFVLNIQMELLEMEWDQQLVNHIDMMKVQVIRNETMYRGIRARAAVHVDTRTSGIDFTPAPVLKKSMQSKLQDLISYTIGGETAISTGTWLFVEDYDAANDFTHGLYPVQEEDGEVWFLVPRSLSARLTSQTTQTVTVMENEKSLLELRDCVLARLRVLENPVEHLENQIAQLTAEKESCEEKIAQIEKNFNQPNCEACVSTDVIVTVDAQLQTESLGYFQEVTELQEQIAQLTTGNNLQTHLIERQKAEAEQLNDQLKEFHAQNELLYLQKEELSQVYKEKTLKLQEGISLAEENDSKTLHERIAQLEEENKQLREEKNVVLLPDNTTNAHPPSTLFAPSTKFDHTTHALHQQIALQKEQLDAQQQALDELNKKTEQKLEATEQSYKGHLESMMQTYTKKIQYLIEERHNSLSTPHGVKKLQQLESDSVTTESPVRSSGGNLAHSASSQASPFIFFNVKTPLTLVDEPSISEELDDMPESTEPVASSSPLNTPSSTHSLSSSIHSYKSLKPIMALWNVFLVHFSDLPRGNSPPAWDYQFLSQHGTLIFAGDEFKYLSERRLHTHSYDQWLHRYFVLSSKTKMPSQPLLSHGLAVFHPALLRFASVQTSSTILKRDARSVLEWWQCINDQGKLWADLIKEEQSKCLKSFSYPLHMKKDSILSFLAESLFAHTLLYLDTCSLHQLSLTCRAFRRQITRVLDVCCVAVLEPFDMTEGEEDWKKGRFSYKSDTKG
eukprot:CAMPEP_0117435518 /NCGR_PEP_ID=MMETSP0759-20121206/524_1 /TAXON_ID=63605 /ORGANISM="Percolomonas cosmopolitus, Strain WS" /LENGTH=1318 /DNA_ID=CAMNT_0005227071 /DNA_START=365 /DNA_END=4321 /DNA_ORIENTATION=-